MDIKSKIASGLETCFQAHGITEPGVDMLRDAAGVSLRTLYKYFPSREDMIVGALDIRHTRYLCYISDDAPASGRDAVIHTFQRIEQWMQDESKIGCLFLNALATHPNSEKIRTAVTQHKTATRNLMAQLSARDDLAAPLFLLHEGTTAAWPLLGPKAIRTAQTLASEILGRS